MVNRAETQAWDGSGSIARTNGLDGDSVTGSAHELDARAPKQSLAALTQRIEELSQQIADSQLRSEQFEEALEKSTRRLHQVMGERSSLTALLAERDAQLLRLSRELGALRERTRPVARSSPVLLKAANGVFGRIKGALEARRASRSGTPQPGAAQRPSPGGALVPWVRNGPPKAVLGVAVFGLSETEIENVLAAIEGYCAEHDLAPLLLTDHDAFQLFRGRRVLFEFLPARSDQERFAPELDWQLYTLRRLALIRRKWQPMRVIAFGRAAAEVVKLWRDSPFEETSIPAALNGLPASAVPLGPGTPKRGFEA